MWPRIVLDLIQNLWKNFSIEFVFEFCLRFYIQLCFYFWKVLSVHLSQRWLCNLLRHATFFEGFICWPEYHLCFFRGQVDMLVADCFYSILTQEIVLHFTTVWMYFALTFKKVFYSLYRLAKFLFVEWVCFKIPSLGIFAFLGKQTSVWILEGVVDRFVLDDGEEIGFFVGFL